jgi:hypothetical protein
MELLLMWEICMLQLNLETSLSKEDTITAVAALNIMVVEELVRTMMATSIMDILDPFLLMRHLGVPLHLADLILLATSNMVNHKVTMVSLEAATTLLMVR